MLNLPISLPFSQSPFSSSSPTSSHWAHLSNLHHHSSSASSFSPSLFTMTTPSTSSLRAGMFSYAGCEEHQQQQQPHFLEACFRCRQPLGCNEDIFMYRGDTPFCSNECRQEQIEIDEANDRSRKMSASMRSLRKTDPKKSSPNKAVRTGTVEVA